MSGLLYKNTLVKIRKSFGRYISLLIITFVGVGFYAGIQATAPDIIGIADTYYKTHNLMDYKIVSSMGLTEDDAATLENLKGVQNATGSYSLDVMLKESTMRVHAIEDSVNKVDLTAGRIPQTDTECVADDKSYDIGDKITIESDVSEKLKNTEYTVVGLARSTLYIGSKYGSTSVGDGKLNSFIFINKINFTLDVYTEIYLSMEGSEDNTSYSKVYNELSQSLNDALVKIKPDREDIRYQEIFNEANNEIAENEKKLESEKSDGEDELAKAKAELDDNMKKIQDGIAEIDKNEKKLNDSVKTKTEEFNEAKSQISKGRQEIDSALSQSGLKKDELNPKAEELKQAIDNMKAQLSVLPESCPEYLQLSAVIKEYSAQYENLIKLISSVNELESQELKLNEGIKIFDSEIAKSRAELKKGREKLAAGEKEIKDGYGEYYKNLEIFKTEISDAENKIADAKKELADMEHPKWFVFNREAVTGYRELDSDIGVIDSLASVFPLFFIAIVMLMTSNTMARMIAEERGELGALLSLGYSRRSIVGTYLLYVLSATGLGGVLGFFAGCTFFPPMIFENFDYILPPLKLQYNFGVLALIMAVTVLLMTAVTIIACHQELKQKPASLLRPLPPGRGQAIFLQKIGVIWSKLSFTWKVTMRNIFRYKKRAFMIIIGVAGCSALMLAGFGIRDSMDGFVGKQYGDIFRYNNIMVLKNEIPGADKGLTALLEKEDIKSPLLIRQSAVKAEQDGKSLETYLIVPENTNASFPDYYNLTSKLTKERIVIDSDSVIITEKIADVLKIGKGGSVNVKDSDNNMHTLKVSDVAENYVGNYIYMDSALYLKTFGKALEFNAITSIFLGDENALAAKLIESDLVLNVTFTSEISQVTLDMNARLNSIIVLIVMVSSVLAVVVLYNLMSINISERKREIATLKVLGFRDGETNSYIYREALILTLISIVLGMMFGTALHRFVVTVIEGTERVFFKDISWLSYLLSFVLTIVFSTIIQVITYFKLKTIDMIDSLKSVE